MLKAPHMSSFSPVMPVATRKALEAEYQDLLRCLEHISQREHQPMDEYEEGWLEANSQISALLRQRLYDLERGVHTRYNPFIFKASV